MTNENIDKQLSQRYILAKRALFDKYYGSFLNSEQCKAVFTAEGPLLVLAGAGSGKTTVLVNRISYLIKYGNAYFDNSCPESPSVSDVVALENALGLDPKEIEEILPRFISDPCEPWRVLAITFTNKAAREIRDRLERSFEDKDVSGGVWAGTFHSICMRILRKHADLLGYNSEFSIYDTDDKKRMVLECMSELGISDKDLKAKGVGEYISHLKDSLITPDGYGMVDSLCTRYGFSSPVFAYDRNPKLRDYNRIYELYQNRMKSQNALDFDDIIMLTVKLLYDHPQVLSYYQNKFRYVLVDEYQDTNFAQFVLTFLIAEGRRNIMVVGDDDQSIYRFRGATVENILNFDKTYSEATVVRLEQNSRSTSNILDCANAIISKNEDRHPKALWCDKGEGELITIKEAADQNDEGRYIVEQIIRAHKTEGRKYSDFAVLYRINALGRAMQTVFAKSGIPYRIIGDLGFYERKEVKDMVAYLSLLSNKQDTLRLKRVINEPKRKIGKAAIEALEQIAEREETTVYEVMGRATAYLALSRYATTLVSFVEMIERIKHEADRPSDMIRRLFEESGYLNMLKAEGFEGEGKIEHVEEFISAAIEYEKRAEAEERMPILEEFLEEVYLITDVDKYDENSDAVVLMTVHAAKGLEFPVVFLSGMEDGVFPSEQNISEPTEMSEERRLCYVAITRAKEKLFISYAKNRLLYGKTRQGMLSCFIRMEAPKKLFTIDKPRVEPPRQSSWQPRAPQRSDTHYTGGGEMSRPSSISARGTNNRGKSGSFGVKRIEPGSRVNHSMFGDGTIVSARDMGGDILYEVAFDSGVVKKLMATYAKLQKL